jgi:O-antigen ligase
MWAVPLALVIGYCLATPDRMQPMMVVGAVVALLITPLLLHFHYPILLFSWNLVFALGFIRGQPSLWMLMAGIGFGIAVLSRILNKDFKLQHVPLVSWSLLFLLAVVVVTGWLTGGIGLRALGSETYGGKKFVFIVAAILGYFAISAIRIPEAKVGRYTGLFFLSGASAVLPNLIYMAGPAVWMLFVFFPTDMAMAHAFEDFSLQNTQIKFTRLTGLTYASVAVFTYLIARFGLAGVLTVRNPLRVLIFVLTFALSLLGGYRSAVVIFALVCALQFYFERLYKTRLFAIALAAIVVCAAIIVPTVSKLPLSVQRSLSMLPLDIDPVARADAQASIEWRLDIWSTLFPQIRTYFWIGKGYAINPSDIYLATEGARRGFKNNNVAIVAGDYHSGPLSVIIPFGIFGAIGFLWFIFASIRVLYLNYKFTEESHRILNSFLLSYFVARFVFFIIGMGALSSDMPFFAGIIAFSVAVNGGVRRKAAEEQRMEESDSFEPVKAPTLAPVPT